MSIDNENDLCSDSFVEELTRFIGTTVTIYATCGGESGCGFTGVLAAVNCRFVKLITCIGPAPCCCIGSTCNSPQCPTLGVGRGGNVRGYGNTRGYLPVVNVGSVAEIPINRIASFVHEAV
jgi:hypothetical protein